MVRWVFAMSMLGALVLIAGCATPSQRVDALVDRNGWNRTVVAGADFRHVVLGNGILDAARPLHVYIEGDGRPYVDRWTVAPDPTPRRPVMLHLMTLDAAPAVYVGRPCYFGLARDPPCTESDWTLGRFGEPVVESMAQVIEQLRRDRGHRYVELYGHSGGGTLAALLAARLPGVVRVVTLAGNLDPDAWARHHGYSPLSGSLNPAHQGRLPDSISQLHLAGARDDSVPAWMIAQAAPRLGAVAVEVVPEVAHSCCWSARWSQLLGEIR